jgi:hypothetical protein
MSLTADDRLDIHELISLHGHLADDRRPEDLGLLLTTDAEYDISAYGLGVISGLPSLIELFSARPGEQPAGHHVTNVIVRERADGTVAVRSKGLSVMSNGATGTVIYEDVVVRTTDGWRISHRRVVPARSD